MPGFEAQREVVIDTPWGPPSEKYVLGSVAGKQIAFLARHGRGHRLSPSELNFRANIYGMKKLGVAHYFAECRRVVEGRTQAPGIRHPGSVLRPHAWARLHLFRRRPGGAHQLFRSCLRA